MLLEANVASPGSSGPTGLCHPRPSQTIQPALTSVAATPDDLGTMAAATIAACQGSHRQAATGRG